MNPDGNSIFQESVSEVYEHAASGIVGSVIEQLDAQFGNLQIYGL